MKRIRVWADTHSTGLFGRTATARRILTYTMRTEADLRALHRFSSRHRPRLDRSEQAGCFYCLEVYDPAEITEWVDEPMTLGSPGDGVTGLCPHCGIDAVLPSAVVSVDVALLVEMRQFWF